MTTQEDINAFTILRQLRTAGLSVAVHNDYRLKGVQHTFWLFTDKTGMSYKGQGTTDISALIDVKVDFIIKNPGYLFRDNSDLK